MTITQGFCLDPLKIYQAISCRIFWILPKFLRKLFRPLDLPPVAYVCTSRNSIIWGGIIETSLIYLIYIWV